MKNKSFHMHHSAFGAFSSFIIGKIGKGGGFVLSDVRPPQSNILIGFKQEGKIKLLPFCTISDNSAEEEFTGEVADTKKEKSIELFSENEINREIGWASDTWSAGNFKFSLITPFGNVKEPSTMSDEEKKFAFAPVIFAKLTLDNTNSTSDAEMIFGIEGLKRRLSQTTDNKYLGAAFSTQYGFGISNSEDVRELSRLDILTSWANDNYQNHDLGRAPSLIFKVPKGTSKTYTIVLATYQSGIITTGIKSKFYYTEVFNSLEEVIEFGLKNADYYLNLAAQRDKELSESNLNEHRKFLIAHATHSYHANTQLMKREDGNALWIVNEGEYIMMNTFDLTIDHVFWEMKFHPWTIANVLDLFVERYSYYDQAGLAFTHDMGVANGFSPKGYSSYELPNLNGCFSYMTHEQLLNWTLTAGVYALKLNDKEWVAKNINIFEECFKSLISRDKNNDGIMDVDSSRCESGSEITTYDSLDVSLGQARNNLYLGMKSWAAYVLLNTILEKNGHKELAEKALKRANIAADTIVSKFDEKEGYIPAVFEKGNTSRIIPAVEALVYPYVVGNVDAVSETGTYGELIKTLKKHIKTILRPGICIDEVSGGWKLSSTSKNTWNSKIFLSQYVIKEILNMNFGDDVEKEWDRVHESWQQVSCSEEAATDQVNSDTGTARGSRLYPRLVTSILWMK
ncbi:Glycosyl hydrolase family 52 [Clostridium sp. USBA 49]|uniref:glycoside hydrolase family 52 protein n=1 Tax=Clostridium sp. USBA 49 TaxID=1881060 RepID=UPI00099ACD3A|nr:glycoside hydrolase family 52 protein [Clostridium sp. USBA 49]SKA74220.1 Glycosyl hydrolase family 52 [Clostridium sp. USBA 49]